MSISLPKKSRTACNASLTQFFRQARNKLLKGLPHGYVSYDFRQLSNNSHNIIIINNNNNINNNNKNNNNSNLPNESHYQKIARKASSFTNVTR